MANGQADTGANESGEDGSSLLAGAAAIEALLPDEDDEGQGESRETPRKRTPKREESRDDEDDLDDLLGSDEEDEDDASDTDRDETDDDTDDEDREDVDEDEDEDRPKSKTRRLKVKDDDGKDIEVDVTDEELTSGYMRQRDYTRKTMAHSNEVKKFKAEVEAPLRQERQQYNELLGKLEEAVQALQPEEDPDWEKLSAELDPEQFNAAFAQHQANKAKLARIRAEREKVNQKLQADAAEQLKEHLENESKLLLEALPAWKKPEIAAREKAKLVTFAKTLGYTDDDIAQVTDHRVLLLLNDALKYRGLQDKRKSTRDKIRNVTKNSRPGARVDSEARNSKLDKARKLAKKTGNVNDAAAAIFEMLPD